MLSFSDRYQIIQPIGRGGVGEVYEGRQVALDRPVAIKVLRPELTRNAKAVARFEREARTTCRLHHPNVVTVFDVGTADDGRTFLIMELLQGKTLADHLRETPRLRYEEVLSIAQQIVRGMGAGQGVGLVHRDLKPDNIFLVNGDHVKILDFGLATLLTQELEAEEDPAGAPIEVEAVLDGNTVMLASGNASTHMDGNETFDLNAGSATPSLDPDSTNPEPGRLTDVGVPMGTPRYMAPEQVLGWDVDHRSDLYSFGCILYEMLAGHTPFEGPGAKDFMRQHLHHPPAPLGESCPDVPDAMLLIVERLLKKGPSERFNDWAALAESLRRLEFRGGAGESKTMAPAESLDPPPEPYRFLHPFTENFQCIFFGRDQDMKRFHDAWRHPDQPPLLILTGASGVGKTSLLAARVIPALTDMGHQIVRIRGGSNPLDQLKQSVARQLARSEEVDPELPLPQLLDQLMDQNSRPVAVILDQLEELFTTGDDDARADLQAGFAALLSTGDSHIRVVVSIREDYLGPLHRCLHPLPVDEISRTVPLLPLRTVDLVAALKGPGAPGLPVAYAPFSFEPGLVDEIVQDLLADPSGEVAPRVQAVGARLWEMVRQHDHPVIRAHHYREGLGGARGILARILNEAITDLTPGDRGVAKEMLRALTHLPGSATSRPTPESELIAYAQDRDRRSSVLHRLENRWRVVQGYADPRWPEERTYRVAHEALITQIREYGVEGSDRKRARQLLHQGYHLWLKGGRRGEDLLPEQHFDEVQRHIEDMVLRSEDERVFYRLCLDTHNEGWMQRHMEARRSAILRRIELTVLPVLMVFLGIFLGQVPVDYISLRTLKVHALSQMGVSRLSLEGEFMEGADLSGLTLRGAVLTDAHMDKATLSDADLQRAVMHRTSLIGADLSRADLRGAELVDGHLSGAIFNAANLRAATIYSPTDAASFVGARFDGTTRWLEGVPAKGAIGPGGRVEKADLSGKDLSAANLEGLRAHQAQLSKAVLREALLSHADLSRADLTGADLSDAQLIGADLSGAKLNGAHLKDVAFFGAIMEKADLQNSDLRGARLRRSEHLESSILTGAIADERTQWPVGFAPHRQGAIVLRPGAVLRNVSLPQRDLQGIVAPKISLVHANLNGANLQDAELRGADLRQADLRRADLRRADLRGARLDSAKLCGADLSDALFDGISVIDTTHCPQTALPDGLQLPDVR